MDVITSLSDDEKQNFQNELRKFIEEKLGKRFYISTVVWQGESTPKKMTAQSITFSNLNPSSPFACVLSLFNTLTIAVRNLKNAIWGEFREEEKLSRDAKYF